MFRLSRYYSIASFIGISIVLIALSIFFRDLALKSLMDHQTTANIDLTKSFSNSVWDKFSGFVAISSTLTKDELIRRPELKAFHIEALKQMRGMNIVKVKIYNLDGITVFSTDAKQIGKDKSKNPGFLQAKSGTAASEITFRDEFYAFEKVIVDRNLIASYIPIRKLENGPVEAVFELYSDVTPLIENMQHTQNKIILGVFSALALLYLFLFVIVKRADRIMARQEHDRKKNGLKIRHQAYHDSLTNLPNRASFVEHLENTIKRANRHKKQCALMFLDLDRFKLINDSLGHDAGDSLLRITASRIQNNLREMDLAFRMSGDEFTVILEDLKKPEDAAVVARRILKNMGTPISLNGYEVITNISIGITTFPNSNVDVDALIKEADAAMYRAKQIGHNRYEFYTAEMNTAAFERLSLETDLQRAQKNDDFVLYYQPKVDINTNELVGVEALLRWQHPEKGIIPPDKFIPILEDSGFINAVGEWVAKTACQQAQQWLQAGLKPIRMSINISAKQFRSQYLVSMIGNALQESGLDPKYLELELTESMFIENVDEAIKTMHKLKELGVALSIDDFGSGYSSLSYLKIFPVDYLKIDRSFIKDLAYNEKDAAITAAISALANSLNLGVIAEGVEDESQLDFLRSAGCHEVQGFLFSRPVPAEEFEKYIPQQPHMDSTFKINSHFCANPKQLAQN